MTSPRSAAPPHFQPTIYTYLFDIYSPFISQNSYNFKLLFCLYRIKINFHNFEVSKFML